MLLLKIYLVFCVLTFLLCEMNLYEIIQEAKREYSDIIKQNKQKIKFFEILCNHIRMFIISFIPIINFVLFYMLLFKYDKMKKSTFDEVDTKINRNNKS